MAAAELQASTADTATRALLIECAAILAEAVERAERVTEHLTQPEHKAAALVNAHECLTMLGHTSAAWMWLRMGTAAARGLESVAEDGRGFYEGKLQVSAARATQGQFGVPHPYVVLWEQGASQ